eukprot:gene46941-63596_t
MLFGGEGLFLATLTGPGKVWLQSMPILNLAEEIARHLPSDEGGRGPSVGSLVGGGAAGAVLDLNMPGRGGLEVLAALKEEGST